MRDSYKSISKESKGLFRDKGSKFIALAFPVLNEDEIKDHLRRLKKEYHDARHHCYAWRLGPEMESYRTNDDGEPSGTAGKPIFGQIRSRELTDIMVVVIRYFGGTLLGVSGLINAYRSASADALEQAMICERKVMTDILVEFPYTAMNSVMKIIKDFKLDMREQKFELNCSISLSIWIRHADAVQSHLQKIEGCKILYL